MYNNSTTNAKNITAANAVGQKRPIVKSSNNNISAEVSTTRSLSSPYCLAPTSSWNVAGLPSHPSLPAHRGQTFISTPQPYHHGAYQQRLHQPVTYRQPPDGYQQVYQTGRYQPDVKVFGQLPMRTQALTSHVSTEQPPVTSHHMTSQGHVSSQFGHALDSVRIE